MADENRSPLSRLRQELIASTKDEPHWQKMFRELESSPYMQKLREATHQSEILRQLNQMLGNPGIVRNCRNWPFAPQFRALDERLVEVAPTNSEQRNSSPPRRKRGRSTATNWDLVKDELLLKIEEQGWPDQDNDFPGWRSLADVRRFVDSFLISRGEEDVKPSTIRDNVKRILDELWTEKDGK